MTHQTILTWTGNDNFETAFPNKTTNTLHIDISATSPNTYNPKPLMLAALGGCSAVDITSLMRKMRLEDTIHKFEIKIEATLTSEHPKTYSYVKMNYIFTGKALNETKLTKAVNLSKEKYCGVMEMFRQFATVETAIIFNNEL